MKDHKEHHREDLTNLPERREEIVDRALTYAYLLSVLNQRRGQHGDSDSEGDMDETDGQEDSEPPSRFCRRVSDNVSNTGRRWVGQLAVSAL